MINRDHFFARMTRENRLMLQNSPPCAKELYQWLLCQAPAGKPAEIHLEEFQAEQSGRLHGKGYQLRWIKDCLKKLIELELVQVVFKFSSKIFKLVTVHANQKNQEPQQKPTENLQANARSQPSNAHSLAPLYREYKETTNRPTLHPVNTNERERAISPPKTPKQPEPKIDPQISQQIEACGFRLNTTLATIVRSTAAQIVLQAIEATQQYQNKLQQQNKPLKREPEAILVAAIKDEWKPTGSDKENEVVPDGFNQWFELARKVGLVGMSSAQADMTGHPSGVLCVRSVSGDWENFEQMRRLHSVVELQEILEKQRSALEFTPSPRLLALQMQGD